MQSVYSRNTGLSQNSITWFKRGNSRKAITFYAIFLHNDSVKMYERLFFLWLIINGPMQLTTCLWFEGGCQMIELVRLIDN